MCISRYCRHLCLSLKLCIWKGRGPLQEGDMCCTRLSRTLVPALLWQLCRAPSDALQGQFKLFQPINLFRALGLQCMCLKTNQTDEDGAHCTSTGIQLNSEYLSQNMFSEFQNNQYCLYRVSLIYKCKWILIHPWAALPFIRSNVFKVAL